MLCVKFGWNWLNDSENMCEVNASKSDQTPLKAWWGQLTWTNSSGELKPWIKYIAVYRTYIEVYMLNEDICRYICR